MGFEALTRLGGLLALVAAGCTHTTLHDVRPWARVVEERPTHVIPHLLILGDEGERLERRRGEEWVAVFPRSYRVSAWPLGGDAALVSRWTGSGDGEVEHRIVRPGSERVAGRGGAATPSADGRAALLVSVDPDARAVALAVVGPEGAPARARHALPPGVSAIDWVLAGALRSEPRTAVLWGLDGFLLVGPDGVRGPGPTAVVVTGDVVAPPAAGSPPPGREAFERARHLHGVEIVER